MLAGLDAAAPSAPATGGGMLGSGTPAMWIGFHVLILVLLVLDLGLVHRRAHSVGVREATLESLAWIACALGFNLWIWHQFGGNAALSYFTAYVLEKSLSADNLFVFVLIFAAFKIPPQSQHRVLYYGIVGAVLMRATFILAGAALVQRFHWVLAIFGVFLLFTAVKMVRAKETEMNVEHNLVFRAFRSVFPSTAQLHHEHFFVRENGKLLATPMLLVLVLIESSDVIFAVDSIPAVFGVTTDAFLIYTSNIFAVLGLRTLYFLLAALMRHMRYLKVGLAAALGIIGAKLCLEVLGPEWMALPPVLAWDPAARSLHMPAALSLGLVLGSLVVSGVASWLAGPAPEPDPAAAPGSAPPHPGPPAGPPPAASAPVAAD